MIDACQMGREQLVFLCYAVLYRLMKGWVFSNSAEAINQLSNGSIDRKGVGTFLIIDIKDFRRLEAAFIGETWPRP